MTLIKTLIPVAIVAVCASTAAPAQAQWRGGWHGGSVSRGFAVTRGHVATPPVVSRVGPRVLARRVVVAPRGFNRPDYSFHPPLRIGSGVWGGYPFTYPYVFGYPFPYSADPFAYRGTLEPAPTQR